MKKAIIFILLIAIFGFSVFVSADASDNYQLNPSGNDGSITLEKGWNLVTNYAVIQVFDNVQYYQDELKAKQIRAIFMYDRYKGEYIRLYPDKEQDKLSVFIPNVDSEHNGVDISEYGGFTNSALWVYSDIRQTINFHTTDGPLFVRYVGLKTGWNFLTLTPEMFYKKDGQDVFSWNGVKGNCNFEKIYAYNPEEQNWMPVSPTQESFDFNDFLWMGMIVKVANNCKLGGDAIAPPSLPGSSDNVPSVDPNPTPTSDFPQTIGTYSLSDSRYTNKECVNDGSLCIGGSRAEYRDSSSNKGIFVNLWDITKGTEAQLKETYARANGGTLETITIGNDKLYRLENHELFWFTGKDYPAVVFTQEGTITYHTDGYSYGYGTATGDNAVTKNFLSIYPSQEVD